MAYRRLARGSRFEPKKADFTFSTGSRNPLPKPEPAKKKNFTPKTKLRRPKG